MSENIQHTFGMIKPDAVKRDLVGSILRDIENADLTITALAMVHMTREQAEEFYAEHKERPFFGELVDFMISGNVVMLQMTGHNAIANYRYLMGATDPTDADEGTLRQKYAGSKAENSVHGSDSEEAAQRELAFFMNAIA